MELVTTRRGAVPAHGVPASRTSDGSRQGEARVLLEYHIPLSEILVDFYDQLKSRTQGYASLDYHLSRATGPRRS